MEHAGMVKMFKTLEELGLKGFLGVSVSVYEGSLMEFFANGKVIANTIVSFVANRKIVITKSVFAEAFQLPTEGLVGFTDLPVKAVAEMKMRFSAKALCAKAGSFDVVTSEKFDLMVAISAGLKMIPHTADLEDSEEEVDFAQTCSQPVTFSSPTDNFDAVAELKTVKRVIESLESKVDMVRDTQTYMRHDSDIFRRAFFRKMGEMVTSVNATT
ncbi:hypothetical protein F511_15940 [Dorcoceras hygrometricum]|uniref:Uncharacterized protein n=1 Tax=Dorcoceras hygrometricum TaxID=472368 RepID=A0A2Z7C6N1_9LAMI|nr:hypothetical protein F511_15940 [Dorcoceras hygrometricum]